MALIIGGHPRSGTTLMTKLCNRHPDIRLTIEFQNFMKLNSSYRTHLATIRKNWYVRGMVGNGGRGAPWRVRLHSARFLASYTLRLVPYAARPIGVVEIERVLHHLFPRARVVGDKYPRYVFNLDALTLEPNLQRIVIYRDGRDVISSMLVKIRGDWRRLPVAREFDTVEKLAEAWVRAIEAMETHRAKLYCIRYEDLIREPREQVRALAAWLDLSAGGFRYQMVRDTSIGKYRTGLTGDELDQVIAVAGPTLARLDYL